MDFSLSEEQKLLADSVDRFVRARYDFGDWRKLARSAEGFSRDNWRQMAELGWLGAAIAEEFGGLGGGPVETMVIAQGLGRGLVLEPYFPAAVLGGTLVGLAGSEAQKRAILPRLAAGETMLAFAYAEPQSRFDLADVATTARAVDGGYVLDGRKSVVLGAAAADTVIVAARTGGERRARQGISLFLVARDAPGLTRRDYRLADSRRAADLALENVRVDADALLGARDAALEVIERAADHAIAALAAEAVGAMQFLHETTLAYLKNRKQFGRPIADFQVLQHRMVDMMIAIEQAKSLSMVATLKLAAPAAERAKAASAAKVQIGRSGRFVGQQAVQLHGGMGMTDELHVGHHMKRLMMIDTLFGNADHHLARFAGL
jgi:alkylation response protein AidB-like acyl-CoA dehydrogenase